MSAETYKSVSDVIAAMGAINLEALEKFNGLSFEQLNWTTGSDRWSIGQCFDHLVITNSTYLPVFDAILSGKKQSNFFQHIPLLPGLIGRLLINALEPDSQRKVSAPKPFVPSSSEIDNQVVDRFVDLQRKLMDYMRKSEGMDTKKIIISSPAAKALTYSLFDAYRIIATHDLRHFAQASRLMETPGFPSA